MIVTSDVFWNLLTWIFSLLIVYPFKVLVRWLVGFLKLSNSNTSFITFIVLTLSYLIFTTLNSQTIVDIIKRVLFTTPIFVVYLVIDLQKSNEHSKFIKFVYHPAVQIIVSVLMFIAVLAFYSQQLHDVFYIKSLLIATVYMFVILRRRTKKTRKVKNNENKGTSSSV